MPPFLQQPWVMQAAVFAGVLVMVLLINWAMGGGKDKRVAKRIERMQQRKQPRRVSAEEQQSSLRRQTADTSLPLIGQLMQNLPKLDQFRARLEKGGFQISAERYIALCVIITLVVASIVTAAGGKILLGLFCGIIVGAGLPHLYTGIAANRRVKKFVQLFPDAIDLIVRGLRSGLPVTESIQMVAKEVQDPVGSIFGSMAESIRLGVPVEKAMQDMAKKLGSTEFNFFVTSVVLQRETGGNLSEILNNLSEVLRSRMMMRMKIKALSSEAKASAIIVGSLPFVVIAALAFIQPDYLLVLMHDTRGNLAALGALTSLGMGIGIMMKMARFEI
jgi:tight adherence protein B